jgi:agmatinase
MPWVKGMAQVGLRGIGSARQREVDDALAFGSVFIRAREVHWEGIDACIKRIPAADNYLITIDTDALDSAIAPGVLFTSPGGLNFDETTDLVRGIARRGPIVGINLFEVRPELDINYLTASTGAQLIINFIGTLATAAKLAVEACSPVVHPPSLSYRSSNQNFRECGRESKHAVGTSA